MTGPDMESLINRSLRLHVRHFAGSSPRLLDE